MSNAEYYADAIPGLVLTRTVRLQHYTSPVTDEFAAWHSFHWCGCWGSGPTIFAALRDLGQDIIYFIQTAGSDHDEVVRAIYGISVPPRSAGGLQGHDGDDHLYRERRLSLA